MLTAHSFVSILFLLLCQLTLPASHVCVVQSAILRMLLVVRLARALDTSYGDPQSFAYAVSEFGHCLVAYSVRSISMKRGPWCERGHWRTSLGTLGLRHSLTHPRRQLFAF